MTRLGDDNIFDDDIIQDEIDSILEQVKPPEKPVQGSKEKPKPISHGNTSGSKEDPIVSFALAKGNEEIELIKRRWKALVSAIEDSAIGNFIMPATIGYAKHLQAVQDLLNYQEDVNALSPEGLANYRYLMKKRSEILAEVFNKYNEEYEHYYKEDD